MRKRTDKDAAPRRWFSRTSDKVIFIVILAVMGAAVALNLLSRARWMLIRSEWYVMLPLLVLALGLGWGLYAIWRRIVNRTARIIVGMVMLSVLFMLTMLGLNYGAMFVGLGFPQRYTQVRAEDGGYRLVVMRMLDSDQDRIDTRHAARLAADPEADPEITADDWGYIYTAYAPRLGFFYREDSLLEGEIHMGFASPARLMVEWEGPVAHFFLEDAGPGDEGEMRATAE